ncbi:lipocalin family protein [Maribellus sp. YY47]|uniref:lipocalin family protein n=1 Tax=Maribellus sp. YY47 TaxID=2929486 RepID=UPI00200109BD|nr:lipocalin family protein [Maribellus sp. YY47]MCK3686183.1 hypothetical protein [Maribellus sp. YY47]
MKFVVTLIVAFFIFFNSQNPKNNIQGTWLMYKVIQNGKDVTLEHDPYHERFLILKSDCSFESGGRPFGKNTGKYEFNENENKLFLDSDTGPEDDSFWNVTIKSDTMFWRGYGSEWAEAFELIQVKKK